MCVWAGCVVLCKTEHMLCSWGARLHPEREKVRERESERERPNLCEIKWDAMILCFIFYLILNLRLSLIEFSCSLGSVWVAEGLSGAHGEGTGCNYIDYLLKYITADME